MEHQAACQAIAQLWSQGEILRAYMLIAANLHLSADLQAVVDQLPALATREAPRVEVPSADAQAAMRRTLLEAAKKTNVEDRDEEGLETRPSIADPVRGWLLTPERVDLARGP